MWHPYAARLLAVLQAAGLAQRPELQRAYWACPRHVFIDHSYAYDATTYTWHHEAVPDDPVSDVGWLDKVYRDEALVVRVDVSGIPSSVNTAPSLAFRVLDWLGVNAGDRVLEVGTGTGQLAGMLGELAGSSGRVVSLEADAQLADSAQRRLARSDPRAPTAVVQADALSWKPGEERFDAVIATGSCWPVPEGWLANLAPGGRLCVELRGRLAGALLLARRHGNGSGESGLTGTFNDKLAGFIPLRRQQEWSGEPLELLLDFVFDEVGRMPADGLGVQQLITSSFAWYCQLEMPGTSLIFMPPGEDGKLEPYLQTDDGMDAVRLPDDGTMPDAELVSFGGVHDLMKRLASAWRDWQAYGRPAPTEYSFSLADDGTQTVRCDGRAWRL
jgi:protein-L-isoaspartate O-methyltransferase